MTKCRKIDMATFTIHQLDRDLSETSLNDFYRLSFNADRYTPEDFKFFNPVARVEASDMDHVFELTNLWNNKDAVRRFMPMHSLSVGDIIETHTGEHAYYIVADCGFDRVEIA